jgi:hypothetical protein
LTLAGFELRHEFGGGGGDRNAHERFGLLLGRQVAGEHGLDGGGQQLTVFHQSEIRQIGVGGDADGAALQA